jgi:hypothetical protein
MRVFPEQRGRVRTLASKGRSRVLTRRAEFPAVAIRRQTRTREIPADFTFASGGIAGSILAAKTMTL